MNDITVLRHVCGWNVANCAEARVVSVAPPTFCLPPCPPVACDFQKVTPGGMRPPRLKCID